MKVECFLGIGMEQPDRVTENRDLGSLDIIFICVGYKQFKTNWKSRLNRGRCLQSCKYGKD